MKNKTLIKYLKHDDEDLKKFQVSHIGLSKNYKYNDIVEKIDKVLCDEIKTLNKDLAKVYKGKYKFTFVVNEDIKDIKDIKINEERKRQLLEKKVKKFTDFFEKRRIEIEKRFTNDQ